MPVEGLDHGIYKINRLNCLGSVRAGHRAEKADSSLNRRSDSCCVRLRARS